MGTAFARSLAIASAIAAAMSLPAAMRSEALSGIDTYRSRGKGRGAMSTSGRKSDNKCNNAGRGRAHQGAGEMARRVRQMARLAPAN